MKQRMKFWTVRKKWNGYDSIASTESSIYRQIGDNVLQKINRLKQQTTVNRSVVASSPTGGAKKRGCKKTVRNDMYPESWTHIMN